MQFDLNLTRDHGVGPAFGKFLAKLGLSDDSPFCINFGGKLYLIGAIHTRDEQSDTYKLIAKIISEQRPQTVFIEGVQYSKGANPPLSGWSGEGYHGTIMAKQYGANYYGAEPSDTDINASLLKKYTKGDILGFYFMRSYKYAHVTAKKSKEKFLADFYELECKHIGISCRGWHHDGWFERRFGKKFRWGANLEYGAPSGKKSAPITRKIAADVSLQRDKFCLKKIEEHLARGERLVVTLGMNHVYAQFEVLCEALGEPTVILP